MVFGKMGWAVGGSPVEIAMHVYPQHASGALSHGRLLRPEIQWRCRGRCEEWEYERGQ